MKAMEVCKGMTALVSAHEAANWCKRNSLAVRYSYLFAKLGALNFVVEQNIFGLSSRLNEREYLMFLRPAYSCLCLSPLIRSNNYLSNSLNVVTNIMSNIRSYITI
jgi:hypothetical protein